MLASPSATPESAPPAYTPARRRRQKTSETDVMGKLKRYEQLLKTHGVKIDEDEEGSRPSEEPTKATCEVFQPQPPRSWDDRTTIGLTAPRPPNAETGTLFIHKEEAHYVENHSISIHCKLMFTTFDLNPEMKILPEEKVGATEMMFSCMRYEVAAAIRRAGAFATDGIGTVFDKHSDASLIGKKDAAIDELDKTFKEKYLKYCDPSIPLHIVIKHMASSVIASMRLMAHHPRQYPDKGASMPQSERDMLFQLSITELEIDNLGYTIKAIRGFVWQISQYFQEDGFIFLLGELRVRLTGEDVDRAWRLVKATYEYHTDMIDNMKNPLYVAIGNLCLKAWRRREEAGLTGLTGYESETPQFIKRLRELRKGSEIAKPGAPSYNFGQAVPPAQYAQVPNYNPQNSATVQNMLQDNANQFANIDLDLDVEMPEINSVDWEYWQTLFDGDSSYDAESGSYFN
ncbi:hypothetical protein M7I_0150 [Glarea lozoyensis 74030]|uniref:Uncharacterized protein n=1 Tax=Glarea lozoyensis (strain ATCC 74030 / MF5533) TaxID=1104152 RepID=H0ECK8_GLAL7|nr:hypothetical protein M7I_0150 [Glarea lozoyensis 74030]